MNSCSSKAGVLFLSLASICWLPLPTASQSKGSFFGFSLIPKALDLCRDRRCPIVRYMQWRLGGVFE